MTKMKMSDYVDLLKSEPTKYRIFLWNILKMSLVIAENGKCTLQLKYLPFQCLKSTSLL